VPAGLRRHDEKSKLAGVLRAAPEQLLRVCDLYPVEGDEGHDAGGAQDAPEITKKEKGELQDEMLPHGKVPRHHDSNGAPVNKRCLRIGADHEAVGNADPGVDNVGVGRLLLLRAPGVRNYPLD